MRDRRKEAEDPDKLMEESNQTGSLDLRNQLVMHYSYIAKSVAIEMSNMYHKYAAVEEMVNQGILAIIDSLDRFDPGHGVKFSTYAFTKVKGAIIDYVRKQDWLPRRVRHPSELLSVGDIITVWVVEVDEKKKRISLTMKKP